jgi:hypothetical protein
MRLHYPAIGQKNKIFLFHIRQALSDFYQQKNHEFSHETRKFVQRVEGQLFLKGTEAWRRKPPEL